MDTDLRKQVFLCFVISSTILMHFCLEIFYKNGGNGKS